MAASANPRQGDAGAQESGSLGRGGREFLRQRIKRTGAREQTLFPNEASNYQLGAQFAAVAGFVLDRAREKRLSRDLPPEWFAQTLLP